MSWTRSSALSRTRRQSSGPLPWSPTSGLENRMPYGSSWNTVMATQSWSCCRTDASVCVAASTTESFAQALVSPTSGSTRRPFPPRRPIGSARSHLAEQQGALHFLDGLGDLDAPGAGVGAVEGGPAAPDALLVVEHGEALGGALVAGVEDEAVGVDDRRRAEVLLVGPEHRAGGRAGGAQDALGGVVEALAFGGRLAPLGVGGRVVVDQEREHLAVAGEERLHVDQQVLADRQPPQRLHGDLVAELTDQHLAGQPVGPVDEHGVRPADPVGAGAPEGQRAVDVPLDPVEQVEHPVHGVGRDLVGLDPRLGVGLGVEAADPQAQLHPSVFAPVGLGSALGTRGALIVPKRGRPPALVALPGGDGPSAHWPWPAGRRSSTGPAAAGWRRTGWAGPRRGARSSRRRPGRSGPAGSGGAGRPPDRHR